MRLHLPLTLSLSLIIMAALAGCGGGGNTSDLTAAAPTVVPAAVTKIVIDDNMTYPYGLVIVNANSDRAKLFLGNTVGGVISRPTDGSVWTCTTGTLNPQSGEIYTYDLADHAKKRYIMSQAGFVERGTHVVLPDGSNNLYFVENRDGHLIKITSNAVADNFFESELIATPNERPYDIKAAPLGEGDATDIVYASHTGDKITLIRGDNGDRTLLTDGLIEPRTVELFQFDGDDRPSILATGLGNAATAGGLPGAVVLLRNLGGYVFATQHFEVDAAAYARLVALDTADKSKLYLVVARGLRDEVLPVAEHEIAIFKYDPTAGNLDPIATYKMPYAYRFDFMDLNGDGILDMAVGSHDGDLPGSGTLHVLLSKNGQVNYFSSQLDTGLVAVNDVKFWTDPLGQKNLFAVADNGNGCPRKVGGSKLLQYKFSAALKNIAVQPVDLAR